MLVMKMDKVLVKVYVPMLEGIYDVWIPSNKRIHEIIVLLVKAIFELSEGCYNPSEMPSLYDKKVNLSSQNEKFVKIFYRSKGFNALACSSNSAIKASFSAIFA